MTSLPWWGYVIIAGLAWGTYVPIIFYGGQELGNKLAPLGGRLASILCVGVAYFVMAVIIPVALMSTRTDATPTWKPTGLVFSSLAGVMGAVGAIAVIFASQAAVAQAKAEGLTGADIARYRIYIAPLIFCLAPLINTLLSLIWHPEPGSPFHFGFTIPSWQLPLGILFVAVGTFLVLYSKEAAEASKPAGPKPAAVTPAGSQEAPQEAGS